MCAKKMRLSGRRSWKSTTAGRAAHAQRRCSMTGKSRSRVSARSFRSPGCRRRRHPNLWPTPHLRTPPKQQPKPASRLIQGTVQQRAHDANPGRLHGEALVVGQHDKTHVVVQGNGVEGYKAGVASKMVCDSMTTDRLDEPSIAVPDRDAMVTLRASGGERSEHLPDRLWTEQSTG